MTLKPWQKNAKLTTNQSNLIFFDTETCGLHGPIVLLQYAINAGPVHLVDLWTLTIEAARDELLRLIEHPIVGFNLTFDWFHVNQMWTVLDMLCDDDFGNLKLQDNVNLYARYEELARDHDYCLKPVGACDLMLHARKHPDYQCAMRRKPVRIRRVPKVLADLLIEELNKRTHFPPIMFEGRRDKDNPWTMEPSIGYPGFYDILLNFAPSAGLKSLAKHALGVDPTKFRDIEIDRRYNPVETGYAPFALAPFIDKKANRGLGAKRVPDPDMGIWWGKWPSVIEYHIEHWRFNKEARKYAEDDVTLTRDLFNYFKPDLFDDDDSVLACAIGAIRWRGFKIDSESFEELRQRAIEKTKQCGTDYNAAHAVRAYLEKVLTNEEKVVMQIDADNPDKLTTKATVLENISNWCESTVCGDCKGMEEIQSGVECPTCGGDGLIQDPTKPHPAAIRAREVINARHAKKELELYDKLLLAGRFHASFNIIGALSGRMSGTDGLNAQGIKHDDFVREKFPLAWPGFVLCGGDLAGSQVSIAAAIYDDPSLNAALESGKKLYTLFGTYLFPGKTYDEIAATKGLDSLEDLYTRAKSGVLAMLFGGEEFTLSNKVGVSEEAAKDAYDRWVKTYPKWGQERQRYFDMFCSMRQPGGRGSRVEWHDPENYIESCFGFKRVFTIENHIVRVLFNIGENPPESWTKIRGSVTRDRKRGEQTVSGATRTACFAAAFALQATNMRAAANHVIQSPEATIIKNIQRRIWELQPPGAHPWQVMPMNVHDEIMCPARPELTIKIEEIVYEAIEEFKEVIPLLAVEWKNNLKSWAAK